LANLGRYSEASVGVNSDGSGSGVEDKPLLGISWVVVPDTGHELASSDVSLPEERSVASHSGLDLHADSVSDWVSDWGESSEVGVPSLAVSIVAVPEMNLLVVNVTGS